MDLPNLYVTAAPISSRRRALVPAPLLDRPQRAAAAARDLAHAEAEAEEWVLPRPTMTTLSDIIEHRNLDDLVAAATVSNIRVFPKDSQYYRPAEMGYPE